MYSSIGDCEKSKRNLIIFILCLIGLIHLTTSQDCVNSRLQSGQCMTLAACPRIIEEFYDETRSMSYGIDFQTFIGQSICGFDGNDFLICCTTSDLPSRRPPLYQPTPPSSFSAMPPPPNYSSYQAQAPDPFRFATLNSTDGINYSNPSQQQPPPMTYPSNPPFATAPPVVFQPTRGPSVPAPPPPSPPPPPAPITSSCGISKVTINRVVGGSEAKRGAYPWIAALIYFYEGIGTYVECAGSLISSTFVITCAHCITPRLSLVRLGAHNITNLTNLTEPNAMDFNIQHVVMHDLYDTPSIEFDIALIQLTSPAPNTHYIGTICLPESNNFLTQDFVGANPFVAGWGRVKFNGNISGVLRDVQVPIISRQTCEENYRSGFSAIGSFDKLICAGSPRFDACNGDSGGPLMMPQLVGGTYRYFLLGLVSHGFECAKKGYPGVYTRVASFIPWIKEHMH